jgi:hypothetical protein
MRAADLLAEMRDERMAPVTPSPEPPDQEQHECGYRDEEPLEVLKGHHKLEVKSEK